MKTGNLTGVEVSVMDRERFLASNYFSFSSTGQAQLI